ncbi:MAG: PAS domain S-box protein [Bauldia sp.]|nr:PAS domain S-box protein [Bauldia sp.]
MSSGESFAGSLTLFVGAIPRTIRTTLGLGLLYLAAAIAGILLARSPAGIPGFWAANAVALTVLLRQERREWWASLAAVSAAGLAASTALGAATFAAIGFTVANVAEIAVAAFVIRRLYDRSFRFDSSLTAYINVQLAAAILAPGLGATIGALAVSRFNGTDYGMAWWAWWTACAMGALVVLPVTLSASPARLRETFSGRRLAEFAGLAVLTIGLILLAIGYSSFPFVIASLTLAAVAMRLNPFATACISAMGFIAVAASGLLGAVAGPSDAWLPTLLHFFTSLSVVMPFGISLLIEQLKFERASAEASEERFGAVMDGAAIGMGLIDTNGNWITANRSLTTMLGYSEAELRSLTFLDVTHPDDRVASADAAMRLFGGEVETTRFEKRYLRKDGAIVCALVATSAVRDKASGAALYLISQLEDITARKQAEAALAASGSRWNFALESARQGVWDVDLRTGKSFHSPMWKALLGYADDEIGEDDTGLWLELVHPDDRARVEEAEAAFIDGRSEAFECEFRVRHKDGHYLWVLDRGRIIERDADGKPLRKIGTYTDITGSRQQAAAIAASENRWNFALESARQGVWDFDVRTRTSFYSPMWKALLGYADDEITVDDSGFWMTLIHPDDLPRVLDASREHMVGQTELFECEFRMCHKDGRWVWILDRGKVIERDADGAPIRMIGTHTDITRQKEAEHDIRRLSHRLQLAASAGRIGLWEMDADTREMWWDDGLFTLFGVPPGSGDGHEIFRRLVPPDDLKRIDDEIGRTIGTGRPLAGEFRLITPSGEVRNIQMAADLVNHPGESRRVLAGVDWDVTEQRRLTQALSEEKERLRVTLESIGDAVICTDTAARVTFINPAATAETGWAAEEAIGRPVTDVFNIIDEATDQPVAGPVEACLRTLERVSLPHGAVLVDRDGRRRDIRETVTPVRAASGEVIGTVVVFQDITGTRQLQRQLAYSAAHDGLTGLLNRASLERELAAVCAATDLPRHVLFFIDLDRFKTVNDTGGHAAGDALLPEIANLLKASVRAQDVTARLGGDEFGLLLRDCPLPQAQAIAGKLIEGINGLEFAFEGRAYAIGACVGIRQIVPEASPDSVLRDADRACYEAKSRGRNRVCVFGADDTSRPAALAG